MEQEELLKKLGKRIVQLRMEKGIRQVDLAINTGIDDGSLRKIEKGKMNITLKTLNKLAEGLNVELKNLFDFK